MAESSKGDRSRFKWPVQFVENAFVKTIKENSNRAKRGRNLKPYRTILYADKIRKEYENLLIKMVQVLPFTEIEIKARPYKQFFALINRAQEIINKQNKQTESE